MACSTRGNSTDTDTCECDQNYYVSVYDSSCSGHGTCIAFDTCKCFVGYAGSNCEQRAFGTLVSVGNNHLGQPETGDSIAATKWARPYESLSNTTIQQISSGSHLSFAISTQGDLFAWGSGSRYRLGTGTILNRHYPSRVWLNKKVLSICSGTYHTVATASTNEVYSWGFNTANGTTSGLISGQMGIGNSANDSSPQLLSGVTGTPVQVACGHLHTLVLTQEGQVLGFGDDSSYGAVGYGRGKMETVPVRVGAFSPIKGVLSDLHVISVSA